MRLPIVALLALFATPLAAPAVAQEHPLRSKTTGERCTPTADIVRAPNRVGPEKLGDQPPAARLYALYNLVDGCSQPIVLNDGIGANPERKLPITRVPARPRAGAVR